MTIAKPPIRLGFFTRLLDQADAAERYRLAIAQIVHAESYGFDSAWIAQHHFHENEGGLPAPFVFLAQVAAQTKRIRLGTGIVTLPLESPIRVAEDAAVLDLMCGGRLEVGIGPGGNLSAYRAFDLDSAERTALLVRHHRVLLDAWAGRPLLGGDRLMSMSRTPEILADAAYAIFHKPKSFTGNFLLDDTLLAGEGVSDFDKYRADPTQRLQIDFFVPDDMPPPQGVSLEKLA